VIDSKLFIPSRAFLTKGIGRHREKLTSFELALRDAGIAQYNLVRVSSIWPPHCVLVSRDEGRRGLEPGQVVFAVVSEAQTNEPSRLARAAIGLAIPADGKAFEWWAAMPCPAGRIRRCIAAADDTVLPALHVGDLLDFPSWPRVKGDQPLVPSYEPVLLASGFEHGIAQDHADRPASGGAEAVKHHAR